MGRCAVLVALSMEMSIGHHDHFDYLSQKLKRREKGDRLTSVSVGNRQRTRLKSLHVVTFYFCEHFQRAINNEQQETTNIGNA